MYPGTLINRDTPELLEGAKIVLQNRGDDSTGWSCSNKFLLWARTLEGDRALDLFRYQLAKKTYSNLFDTHAPFQIDGNFGSAAGVMELLMQSQTGTVYILPALPKVWDKGEISGIKAKNGAEISIKWEDNKATQFTVTPAVDGDIVLGYDIESNKVFTTEDGQKAVFTDGKYTIENAEAGKTYTFNAVNDIDTEPEIVLTQDSVSVTGTPSGQLIVAGYDQDGRIIKTDVIDGYTAELTEYNDCRTIRAFLWNNIEDMQPVCESQSVTLK